MKGLAAQQIVLLVVAVLILAAIAFLVFRAFTSGSDQFSAAECKAECIKLCAECKFNDWGTCTDQGNFVPNGKCVKGAKEIGLPETCIGATGANACISQDNCKKCGVS